MPHGNDRLLRHNFRGEERDKARTEKPLGTGREERKREGWKEEKVAGSDTAKTSA